MMRLLALVIETQKELIEQQQIKLEQAKAVIERQHQDLVKMESIIYHIVIREQMADAFKKHYGLN